MPLPFGGIAPPMGMGMQRAPAMAPPQMGPGIVPRAQTMAPPMQLPMGPGVGDAGRPSVMAPPAMAEGGAARPWMEDLMARDLPLAVIDSLLYAPSYPEGSIVKSDHNTAAGREALDEEFARQAGRERRDQAISDALQRKRGMAEGGELSWEQSAKLAGHIGHPTTGFLHSSIPGRTDLIHAQPPVGSFVVPADVVSGIGQGNSLAGAAILQKAFAVGPYGVPLPSVRSSGPGIPKPPPVFSGSYMAPAAKRGGRTRKEEKHVGKPTPILAAGGEFIVPVDAVREIGGGDLRRGHDALDAWVVETRRSTVKEMARLPGPKR